MVTQAELRRRWRSWLALAVLVAGIGGLVLATAAAGWRTASAFPRYLSTYGFDSFVYAGQPLDLASLPEVRAVVTLDGPASGDPRCACTGHLTGSTLGLLEVSTAALPHFAKLVSGRFANPVAADEVVASYTLQHDFGLHLGSVVSVPLFSAAQGQAAFGSTDQPPAGPTVSLRIVGFEASEPDFPSVGTPNYTLLLTPAFGRAFNAQTFLFRGYAVHLRRGAADLPRLDSDIRAVAAGTGSQESATSVTSAIHPQAVGWWVLAVFIGLAGTAAAGQALRRQAISESVTNRTLWAVGLGPGELRGIALARTLAIGVAGAVGAVILAAVLSPLAPLGEARVADPSPGFAVNLSVLGLGAAAIVVLVALVALLASAFTRQPWRAVAAEQPRPSRIVGVLAAWRLPASALIGIRRAVERGHGEQAVPVGNALVGTAVAVAALCGTAVFGASLGHLVATPPLYGQAFSMWFNSTGTGPDAAAPILAGLHQDPTVRRVTLGVSGAVEINGVATDAIAGQPIQGPLLISSVQGRVPGQAGEVALGSKTLHQAHAQLGSSVKVTVSLPGGGSRTSMFRVVGIAAFPPDFGVVGLNRGAIFDIDGLVAAECGSGPAAQGCADQVRQQLDYVVLAGFAPTAAGRAAVARYVQQYPQIASLPQPPTNLVNFGQAVNFPLIVGLVVALFSATTVIHVLVVSVARRRRELGLLKTLGLLRHQVVAAVCWQACTVAAVGIVVGVPLGIAAGREVWRAFATNLGVVAVPVVPVVTVVGLCAAVVVGANLLAAGPAAVSARARPASILRSE